MIYKLLLRRPIGICPHYNPYPYTEKDKAFVLYEYRYKWARIEGVIFGPDPSRAGTETSYLYRWKTCPTKEQMAYISENPTAAWIPATRSKDDLPGDIRCRPFGRKSNNLNIYNSQTVSVSGLMGLGLLATNRQINNEAAGVLYGENTFFFDMRDFELVTIYGEECNSVPASAFEVIEQSIIPTQQQIKETVDHNFNKDANQHEFIHENSFTKFLRVIGTSNAALIKALIFKLDFKPLLSNIGYIETQPYINFDEMLEPLSFILKHSCPSLLNVNLSGECDGDYTRASNGEIVRVEKDKSYLEDFDMIVGPLVKYLPSLRKLRLEVFSGVGRFMCTLQKELERGHEIVRHC